MNKLRQTLSNKTYNEKGALTNASTRSALLDFYSNSGAQLGQFPAFWANLVSSWRENDLHTLRALFQSRAIRVDGSGLRQNFRDALVRIANGDLGADAVNALRQNLVHVPFYGRWDDLWVLIGTPLESNVLDLAFRQFKQDQESLKADRPVTLLAKWLPSINTTSKETRLLANRFRNRFGLSVRDYRKALVALRSPIRLVETQMSNNEWDQIDYSRLPSKAHMNLRKAFMKHDPVGYQAYLDSVESGEVKINAGTIQPHEIVRKLLDARSTNRTLEAQWNALPDYLDGRNIISVVDVSGSMNSGSHPSAKPIEVALAVGVYTAQRSKGEFNNSVITFSKRPQFQELRGSNLYQVLSNLNRANWDMTTNFQAVFNMILDRAVANNVPQSDMPEVILTISDMQFDSANGYNTFTNLEEIKRKYAQAGYNAPVLVFWNVNSRGDAVAEKDDRGVIMVSGFSVNAFITMMSLDTEALLTMTPYDYMMEVLNSEAYQRITIG